MILHYVSYLCMLVISIWTSLFWFCMQVVIEKLREWFATEILQPLENAADCAHINVVNAAVPVGFPGIRLTALNELGE